MPAAHATDTYAPEIVVPFDGRWSFWLGDTAPPDWPLSQMPSTAGNALDFLPEAIPSGTEHTVTSRTARRDSDRILPLRDIQGGLLTEGTWWSGFHAPFSARSEQHWNKSISSWLREKSKQRRKRRPAFSRTGLIYPTGLAATAAPGEYDQDDPEPGLTNMYFIKRFNIKDLKSVVALHLHARYKKGIRVFINGEEVARARVKADAQHGDFGIDETSPHYWIRSSIRGSQRWEEVWSGIPPTMLKAGENVIAAVVHKADNAGSPGMYFDAQLQAHTDFNWVKKPYLHRVTQDGVTVSWETTAKSYGQVIVKDPTGQEVGRPQSQQLGVFHEVQIRGLTENTQYTYQVISRHPGPNQRLRSTPLTFTTAPADDSPFVFMLYGDSRWGTRVHRPLAELMAKDSEKYGANLVVHTGDIVSRGYQWNLWQEKFFAPAEPLISRVPIYPVPGNHELNAQLYYDYFDLPNNEAWYHFRYGMADFFGLNTNTRFGPSSEQHKWFVKTLEESTARWKIVFMHHPAFACAVSRKPGTKYVIRYLVPLFEKYGVDLVLLGHDHVYGRSTDVNGVHYIISGGGGSSLYRSRADSKMTRCDRKYNYVRLHVDGRKIRWLAYDEKGLLIEEYAIGPGYTNGTLTPTGTGE